jgi:hypothetical protein
MATQATKAATKATPGFDPTLTGDTYDIGDKPKRVLCPNYQNCKNSTKIVQFKSNRDPLTDIKYKLCGSHFDNLAKTDTMLSCLEKIKPNHAIFSRPGGKVNRCANATCKNDGHDHIRVHTAGMYYPSDPPVYRPKDDDKAATSVADTSVAGSSSSSDAASSPLKPLPRTSSSESAPDPSSRSPFPSPSAFSDKNPNPAPTPPQGHLSASFDRSPAGPSQQSHQDPRSPPPDKAKRTFKYGKK